MPRTRRQAQEPPPHTIHAMSTGERPRERLLQFGAGALNAVELLAILLRTGYHGVNVIQLSQELLTNCGRLGGLARTPVEVLAEQKGMGPAKAAELAAAFELGRRAVNANPAEQPQIKSPAEAAQLLCEMGMLEKDASQSRVPVDIGRNSRRASASPFRQFGKPLSAQAYRIARAFARKSDFAISLEPGLPDA